MSERAPDGTAFDVAGDGPPVVLIHGLGLCMELWDASLPMWAEAHRAIRYDLYGHGESAPVPRTADLHLYAQQIVGLLDHLDVEQAHIVGFSIGGMINRRLAFDFPDRVASLAILNSPHDRGEAAQQMVEERAATVRNQGALSTMDDALKRWFTPGHLDAHPEHEEAVRRWRVTAEPESYAQAVWVLANGVRELCRPADPITCPSLVLTSEFDTGSTPAMTHSIAAEIPGSETVIVSGMQHLGLMQDPAAFVDPVLAFLKGLDR